MTISKSPRSLLVATSTSNRGSGRRLSSIICITLPTFFSVTKIPSGPRNAILVESLHYQLPFRLSGFHHLWLVREATEELLHKRSILGQQN